MQKAVTLHVRNRLGALNQIIILADERAVRVPMMPEWNLRCWTEMCFFTSVPTMGRGRGVSHAETLLQRVGIFRAMLWTTLYSTATMETLPT